jgi:hypothetical protein
MASFIFHYKERSFIDTLEEYVLRLLPNRFNS